ncbi:MAG: iron-containing alcohol dehydrogenase [Alphaproteobacteria bacterium]|nr:iron-containing alcohol dehydrogenase [Alphaproteobacteria bacterium]
MNADLKHLRGTWNFPTTIWFGAGKISLLARACQELGIQRPLLVTDPGLARLPMIADALNVTEEAGISTTPFSEIKGNPVGRNIIDGVAALRDSNCDGVIAFGGGSSLDAGKSIALMAAQPTDGLDLWDFEEGRKDWQRAEGPLPVIAVPTTAGTGSETGRSTVVLNEDTGVKVIITHPGMLPRIVIADPELTLGLPRDITAATGMDALAHCLEAYCSPFHNPMCDGVAIEGMRLIKENLPTAVTDGSDLVARSQMLAAAAMGSTAFQKGLGAIHAMSHPIGALYDSHHGLTNAVVMPYVLAHNQPAIEQKISRLSAYLGLTENSGGGFQAFLDWTLALRRQFELPHTLAEFGVAADDLDRLAEMAAADPTAGANPVSLDVPRLRHMFEDAFTGTLVSGAL